MIAHIHGTVIHADIKFVVVDVSGVGYKVYATADTISVCTEGTEASFWTYTAVRENSLDLYGFTTMQEMEFFDMLLDVSGIGPKSALGILSVASLDTLQSAMATGDTSYLNKVSGIGKKTAEKIVIELRDKLVAHKNESSSPSALRGESDVVEALKSLGYSPSEARDVLRQIPSEIVGANARIKEALKLLGKNN
jgi:Holliday junction DNA helicase RuvA